MLPIGQNQNCVQSTVGCVQSLTCNALKCVVWTAFFTGFAIFSVALSAFALLANVIIQPYLYLKHKYINISADINHLKEIISRDEKIISGYQKINLDSKINLEPFFKIINSTRFANRVNEFNSATREKLLSEKKFFGDLKLELIIRIKELCRKYLLYRLEFKKEKQTETHLYYLHLIIPLINVNMLFNTSTTAFKNEYIFKTAFKNLKEYLERFHYPVINQCENNSTYFNCLEIIREVAGFAKTNYISQTVNNILNESNPTLDYLPSDLLELDKKALGLR